MSALEEPREPATPEWTLGERLKKARESRGLTKDQMVAALLARGYKTSTDAIYKWEADTNLPATRRGKDAISTITTLDVLRMWAEIANVPHSWVTSSACYTQFAFDIDITQPALSVVR